MLFSGMVSSYQCQSCAAHYDNVGFTSLIPICATCGVAGVFWGDALRHWIYNHWIMSVAGIAVALLVLTGFVVILEHLTTSALRAGRCPKCGGELKNLGTGFYDGLIPQTWELIIYALTIGSGLLARYVANSVG